MYIVLSLSQTVNIVLISQPRWSRAVNFSRKWLRPVSESRNDSSMHQLRKLSGIKSFLLVPRGKSPKKDVSNT